MVGGKETGVGKKESTIRWAKGLSKTNEVAPKIMATVCEEGYQVILVRQNHSMAIHRSVSFLPKKPGVDRCKSHDKSLLSMASLFL